MKIKWGIYMNVNLKDSDIYFLTKLFKLLDNGGRKITKVLKLDNSQYYRWDTKEKFQIQRNWEKERKEIIEEFSLPEHTTDDVIIDNLHKGAGAATLLTKNQIELYEKNYQSYLSPHEMVLLELENTKLEISSLLEIYRKDIGDHCIDDSIIIHPNVDIDFITVAFDLTKDDIKNMILEFKKDEEQNQLKERKQQEYKEQLNNDLNQINKDLLWEELEFLSKEIIKVKDKNDKWGLINKNGKIILKPKYSYIYNSDISNIFKVEHEYYMESIADRDKYGHYKIDQGFINQKGKEVIKSKYADIEVHNKFVILYTHDEKIEVLDSMFKKILKTYDDVDFENDHIILEDYKKDTTTILDNNGTIIIEDLNYDVEYRNDIYIIYKFDMLKSGYNQPHKYGAMNRDGIIILAVDYDEIDIDDEKIIITEKDNQKKYFNYRGVELKNYHEKDVSNESNQNNIDIIISDHKSENFILVDNNEPFRKVQELENEKTNISYETIDTKLFDSKNNYTDNELKFSKKVYNSQKKECLDNASKFKEPGMIIPAIIISVIIWWILSFFFNFESIYYFIISIPLLSVYIQYWYCLD